MSCAMLDLLRIGEGSIELGLENSKIVEHGLYLVDESGVAPEKGAEPIVVPAQHDGLVQ